MTCDGAVRRIMFHADDLGMNPAVNAGIFRGFEQGLLTSTSILTNAPHAGSAFKSWKNLIGSQGSSDLPSSELRTRLGELDLKVPAGSRDEIGDLAVSFNHMAQALRARGEDNRQLVRALEETKQVKARAARLLGVSERSLWYKLRKHSLN